MCEKNISFQLLIIQINCSQNFYVFPTTKKTIPKRIKNRIHMWLFLHYFLKNGIIVLRF